MIALRTAVAMLLAVTVLLQVTPAYADPADDLIDELMCPSPVISRSLAASDTPEAVWMKQFVRAKMAEGWSRDRIVDTLVRQYGDRILSSPSKEGFSLAAWITPFVTIFGSAGVIAYVVTGWLRQRRWHDAYLDAEVANFLSEEEMRRYESQLLRDLEQFP